MTVRDSVVEWMMKRQIGTETEGLYVVFPLEEDIVECFRGTMKAKGYSGTILLQGHELALGGFSRCRHKNHDQQGTKNQKLSKIG